MDALIDNRLLRTTSGLLARGETRLAPYLTAGDGGLRRTQALLEVCEEEGAACVELGVPFTDPIADGPVLQAAAQRALLEGTTLPKIEATVASFRRAGGILPIIAFSYLNPLLAGGLDARLDALAKAGVDGLLVPDIPVEEAALFSAAAEERGLSLSLFCAPTTSEDRLELAARATRAFLYVVGRTGVTGARPSGGGAAQDYLARVRAKAEGVPLGVGFGIATAEHVAAVAPYTELAIVGSAFVKAVHEAPPSAALTVARSFLRTLGRAFDPAP